MLKVVSAVKQIDDYFQEHSDQETIDLIHQIKVKLGNPEKDLTMIDGEISTKDESGIKMET